MFNEEFYAQRFPELIYSKSLIVSEFSVFDLNVFMMQNNKMLVLFTRIKLVVEFNVT